MISFICSSCNRIITVDQKYSGKKGRCPKCKGTVVVPERSTVIVFNCTGCGHKIRVPDKYGGKKGKCPKCHEPVIIPTLEKEPVMAEEMVNVECQMCGQTIEVPQHAGEAFTECPSCGSYIETSFRDAMTESDALVPPPIDENQYEEESEEYEESAGVDRRFIIIISAVAAVVIVGLVVTVAVMKLSRPRSQRQPERQISITAESQVEADLAEAKAFAEEYISLLEKGEVEEAFKHHGPELAKDVYRFSFEKLSEQIASSRITEMNCTQTQRQQHPEGERISLRYDLSCEQGTQNVDITIFPTEQDFKVDRISARDSRGNSTSIGLSVPDFPSRSVRTTLPQRVRPSSGKLFTVIITGFAIGTFFSAVCLWIGMKITRVEGTFITMLVIAAISSLVSIIPSVFFIPCIGLVFNLVIMVVLICKWTDAELWPEAIGIVVISGFVGMFAIKLLEFIVSLA